MLICNCIRMKDEQTFGFWRAQTMRGLFPEEPAFYVFVLSDP